MSRPWHQALHRGAYAMALATVERAGIPIDAVTLDEIRAARVSLHRAALAAAQARWGFWAPAKKGDRWVFKRDRVEAWIAQHGWIWPVFSPAGKPSLDKDVLADVGRILPEVAAFREARALASGLRLETITTSADGRSHPHVFPVATITGRNKTKGEFIFGQSRWLRHLIVAPPGRVLLYVDWTAQEYAIMAALSQDPGLLGDYRDAPDPYLSLAHRFGLAPAGATKHSHTALRDQFKLITLAVGYGMGPGTLRAKLQVSYDAAGDLLEQHHALHPRFWRWSNTVVAAARLQQSIETIYGWRMRVHPGVNDRTLRNWLVQATAADMLRVALIYLVRAGIQVDAVVHDAVLIECDTDALATVLPRTQAIMAEASRRTLRGRLTLRTDAVVIPPGTRYPSHGADLWNWTMAHIGRPDAQVTPEPLRRPAIENPVAVGGTA